jgi:hypothetical protein
MPEVCGWCSGSRVTLEVTSKKKAVVRKQPSRLDADEDSDHDVEEISMEPLTYGRASVSHWNRIQVGMSNVHVMPIMSETGSTDRYQAEGTCCFLASLVFKF